MKTACSTCLFLKAQGYDGVGDKVGFCVNKDSHYYGIERRGSDSCNLFIAITTLDQQKKFITIYTHLQKALAYAEAGLAQKINDLMGQVWNSLTEESKDSINKDRV